MGNIVPSFTQVHPSFIEPGVLLQQFQVSGFLDLFAGQKPQTRIGSEDLYVYMKTLTMRTRAEVAQTAGNELPSSSLVFGYIQTPTYLIRTRAEYDYHDTAAAGNWGISLPAAQRVAGRQAIFQSLRGLALYGKTPSNGEGLLNTAGATAVTLPADTNGNTTAGTYDNGQMSFFLLTLIQQLKQRMFQLGLPNRIAIVGPQRILGPWEFQDIVQLTQFQRVGGGSTNTAGLVKEVVEMSGNTIDFAYDDTLIGKGQGGTDAVIISVPELIQQRGAGVIATNEFSDLSPNLAANTLMYMDKAAPTEIPTPIAGGAIDIVFELRATCGWAPRPESTTILSIAP